ncbi:diguanylate cyclase domain-containing protein [Compostimonas suwonensis]|uniref:diguanylate cyclase domain-containing protein n=1 Tax=Compostimonas suwonensis TaxID=1048394 RepID=UPI0012FE58C5|nr:diguanylate cyclase [Compostimonas suwonensis]
MFDLPTLLGLSALVVCATGVVYFLDSTRALGETSARYWGLAFVSAALTTLAFFVSGQSDDVWWSVAVGNAGMVFTLGAVWAGCRVFNGRRRSFLLLAFAVTVIVGVASSLPSPDGSKWAGTPEKLIALTAFSALIACEALRAPMGRYSSARLLSAVLWLETLYSGTRLIAFWVVGPRDQLFSTVYSTQTTTVMNIVFVVVTAVSMITLRAQDTRRRSEGIGAEGAGSENAVLDRRAFLRAGAQALDREGSECVLLAASVDSIATIRVTHGRERSMVLMDRLASALRTAAPEAQLGRIAGDRLGLLLSQAGLDDARAVAASVQEEFARTAAPEDAPVGPTVSIGIAEQPPGPGDFRRLVRRASAEAERTDSGDTPATAP